MVLARAQRSQRWLAEQTGISAATLSRKMRGDGSITLGEVLAICAAIQVSATDIVARLEHPELDAEFDAIEAASPVRQRRRGGTP